MTTERIIIQISVRGDRMVSRRLGAMGKRANRARLDVDRLKLALTTLTASLVVRQLVRFADAFRFLQNRIRVVTDSQAELTVVTAELAAVARRSRVDFKITAEIYSRLAIASKELGVSQQEVLNVTESLNKIITISGARSKEATNALIQLSQGIASNTLRGDELRAVLEQLPILARFIAKDMGISFGEVRKFAAEGKITADVIFKAVRNSRDEIEESFKSVLPTLAQGWTVLTNAMIIWIGNADLAVGASTAISNAMLFLADNIDNVARAFFALIAVIAVFQGFRLVALIVGAVISAFAASPILAVVAILTGLITLMVTFADKIKIGGKGLANLQDLSIVVWRDIKMGLKNLIAFMEPALDFMKESFESFFGEVDITISGILLLTGRLLDEIVAIALGVGGAFSELKKKARFDEIKDLIVKIGQTVLSVTVAVFLSVGKIIREAIGDFTAVLDAFITAANAIIRVELPGLQLPTLDSFLPPDIKLKMKLAEVAAAGALAVAEAAKEGFEKGMEGAPDTFEDFMSRLLERVDDQATGRIARQLKEAAELAAARAALNKESERTLETLNEKQTRLFGELLRSYDLEITLLGKGNEERRIARQLIKDQLKLGFQLPPLWLAILQAQIMLVEKAKTLQEIWDEIIGPIQVLVDRLALLTEILDRAGDSTGRFASEWRKVKAELLILDNTFFSGFQAGLLTVADEVQNFGQNIHDWIVGAFDGATEAIVEFARTGKFEFKQFASSIVNDLLRIATMQLFAQGIGLIPGFRHGGNFTVGGAGGPDSQLVAFRASPGEEVNITPPGRQGGAGSTTVNTPISIVNVTDPDEIPMAMDSPAGEQVILNVINRNPNVIRRMLPGG